MKIEDNSAKVRFPPPLVYLGLLLLGFVLDRVAGLAGLGLPMTLRLLLAAAAVAPGIALIIAAVGGFRHAGTPPEPWRTVTALVTNGIYRFTRNPMYLGMAAIHLGIALAADSLGGLAGLPFAILAIQTSVIAREERYMTQSFGAAYIDYRKRVRRWL